MMVMSKYQQKKKKSHPVADFIFKIPFKSTHQTADRVQLLKIQTEVRETADLGKISY